MCLEDVTIARQKRTNMYCANGSDILTVDIPARDSRLAVRLTAIQGSGGELRAVVPGVQGASGISEVTLCVVAFDSVLTNSVPSLPVSDVTLDDVGEVLKGPLRLVSAKSNVYAIETFLDINTPYDPLLTKLPTAK